MKVLLMDPVFSNWVNFIEKMAIIICSRNKKSFKGIYFRKSTAETFQKTSQYFFSVHLPSVTLFQHCWLC